MLASSVDGLTQPIGPSFAIHTYPVYGEFSWKICRQRKKAKQKLLYPACWTIKFCKSLINALGGGIAHHVCLSSYQSMENGFRYRKPSLQICLRDDWARNYSVIRLVGWSVFNPKPKRESHARLLYKGRLFRHEALKGLGSKNDPFLKKNLMKRAGKRRYDLTFHSSGYKYTQTRGTLGSLICELWMRHDMLTDLVFFQKGSIGNRSGTGMAKVEIRYWILLIDLLNFERSLQL